MNPVKTEFVTFCGQCGRKLDNNFQDWKRDHPEKSFSEFKNEVCLADGTSKVQVQGTPVIKWIALTFTAILIVWLTVFVFRGGDLRSFLLPYNTPASVVKGDWQRFTYGKYGISIDAPEKLVEREMTIPDSYQKQVMDVESYYYRPSRGFRVTLTAILYHEGIRVNLEGASVGAINEMINQPGISNVEFKESPLNYNDVRGVLLEGSFHENGVFMKFMCAIYARRSNVWQAMIVYRNDDNNGRLAASRVLESLEINYYVKPV